MASKSRRRISAGEAAQITKLEARLGSNRFRNLMSDTGGSARLIRPERESRWRAGRGTLTGEERDRLALINSNANALVNLSRKAESKKVARVNRALKDWLLYGGEKGADFKALSYDEKETQMNAIRALAYLGVDPTEGTYYVKRRAA